MRIRVWRGLETWPSAWDTRRTTRTVIAAGALLLLLAGSSAGAPAEADIVVATTSDASNGDTSSVAALNANPGSDGVSLREAIEATNHEPGTWTIGFAPSLRGKTITLAFDLPPLSGGGVTIEGAGVTLRTTVKSSGSPCARCALQIASSGNRLHALTLQGFGIGVLIEPGKPGGALPTHQTLADNVVSGFVMRGISDFGVELHSPWSPTCGVPKPKRCLAYDRWTKTTIIGNTIESGATGISAKIYNGGDRIDHVSVTGNKVRINGEDAGIGFEIGNDATQARISDVLIARNTIEGEVDIGINVASGAQRAQANAVEAVRVLDNRIHLVKRKRPFCCQGIVVQAGSDSPEAIFPNARPLRYPDGNVTRNVLVRGNSIAGTIVWGVTIQAGAGAGGSRNRVERLRAERNAIGSSIRGTGVFISAGAAGSPPYRNRIATGNRVSDITIAANRIALGNGRGSPPPVPGGVGILSGGQWGHGNSISCVRIAGNRIRGTSAPISVQLGSPGNSATLGSC